MSKSDRIRIKKVKNSKFKYEIRAQSYGNCIIDCQWIKSTVSSFLSNPFKVKRIETGKFRMPVYSIHVMSDSDLLIFKMSFDLSLVQKIYQLESDA